jgi:acetyl-CoA carboxylase carboxyltransferase component
VARAELSAPIPACTLADVTSVHVAAAPAISLADRAEESLSARDRLELLCDPGSLALIRTDVASRFMGAKSRPGDGVVAGSGVVGGRPIFCYAQDATYLGGSLGEQHAETIVRVMRLAHRAHAPVIGFVGSAGARLQEGMAALGGYGRIFREIVLASMDIPQISIITGLSAGGGAYSPALTDWVVMTEASSMFLTGPSVVREVMGEHVSASELGGTRVHQRNGVCHLVAREEIDAARLARELLGYLPQHVGALPPRARPEPASKRNPAGVVPVEGRRVYDVREVIRCVVDGGRLLELCSGWARNIVTGFARIDGVAVGVIANQPRYLGGVLDADSSQKGARFVDRCNKFGIPLVVLVDTPGYLPGTRQEAAGVIRFGATLVHAFAAATVPRMTAILRKAFGGAFITMNSKDLGADYVFAWPQAEIGVMGAKPAVGIMHRRDLAAADDPEAARERLSTRYAETHLRPHVATREGFVDELIAPVDTRPRLISALRSMGARVEGPGHGA